MSVFKKIAYIAVASVVLAVTIFGFKHWMSSTKVVNSTSQVCRWIPFSAVSDSRYIKTDGTIYWNGFPLSGSDPATFFVLEKSNGTTSGLSRDANHFYDGAAPIIGPDPLTFTTLSPDGCWYGLEGDKSHAYFGPDVVPGADPATLVFVGIAVASIEGSEGLQAGYYYSDRNHVYWSDRGVNVPVIIRGADPVTFKLADPMVGSPQMGNYLSCGVNCWFDAQDKSHKYLQGEIVK